MEETWNLITPWEKLWEDLCHISPFDGQGERAQEPWWAPWPWYKQKWLFYSRCGRDGICSHEAGLKILSRQFFNQVTRKQLKPLLLGETGGLFEVGLQRGCRPTSAGALFLFPKPHPYPHLDHCMLLWLLGMQGFKRHFEGSVFK